MRFDIATLLATSGARGALAHLPDAVDDQSMRVDVAIVGAGASGTYAAIRLREDYNASIAVVEPAQKLGGHVATFHDAQSNSDIDYGVQAYVDYGPARSFFHRLGIETGPRRQGPPSVPIYVDSAHAALLRDYEPPGSAALSKALAAYLELVKKYDHYLLPGLWNFPSGQDIPEDLLLPFEDFAQKYGIEAVVPLVQAVANSGVGGFQGILTLHVMAFGMGSPAAQGLVSNTFFNPAHAANSIIYEKAYERLKDVVMLQTSVTQATRTADGVQLTVSSRDGTTKSIQAKQLLLAFPPSLENLAPFALDATERATLRGWTPTYSFAGLVRTSALPANHTVGVISRAAVPNRYLHLWDDGSALTFNPKGDRLYQFLIASNVSTTPRQAQAKVLAFLDQIRAAGTFPAESAPDAEHAVETTILALADHSSLLHRLPAERYREGWIQDFYSLQGRRSTWYTGSLWAEDFSSAVWAFTDTVLERLVPRLRSRHTSASSSPASQELSSGFDPFTDR